MISYIPEMFPFTGSSPLTRTITAMAAAIAAQRYQQHED